MNIKKGMFYVLVANVINLVISIFSGFVLPKFLSIDTYADIKLFQLYITYIGILHLGFADGMYIQHGGKSINNIDKQEVADEFKTFKIFQIFITFISIIICLILKNKILLFCALVILPINIGNYLRNLYSSIGEFKKYSRFTNISTLLIFIINLFLLFIIKTDDSNIYIIGYIVVYFIYLLIIEVEHIKLFGKRTSTPKKNYFTRDIKSGFFLMIGSFCNVIFTSIDRLFVKNLLGKIKFAFYSFAVSIENLMNVFINPISTTLYNYFCNHNTKEDILKIKRLLLIFSAIVLSLVFPARFIVDLWLVKYKDAVSILFILFAAQYMAIMVRCVHINLYKAFKKQNKYFAIMLLVVILSVILNIIFYFIHRSMELIALATLITNIIWFVIGEIDFGKYKLKLIEYIYIFAILIAFLLCLYTNAIIGFGIYVTVVLVLTILILNSTFKYCLKEFTKALNIFIKKKGSII